MVYKKLILFLMGALGLTVSLTAGDAPLFDPSTLAWLGGSHGMFPVPSTTKDWELTNDHKAYRWRGDWMHGLVDTVTATRLQAIRAERRALQPGPKGENGDKGDKGDVGAQGLQGPQGLPGPAGEDGSTGSRGLQGEDGTKGDIGSRGLLGPQGLQGVPGLAGRDGAEGITWLTRAEYRDDLKEKTDEIATLREALAASREETSELKSQMLTMSTCMKAMVRSLTTREPLDLDPTLIFKVVQLPDLSKSDAEPREDPAEAGPPDA